MQDSIAGCMTARSVALQQLRALNWGRNHLVALVLHQCHSFVTLLHRVLCYLHAVRAQLLCKVFIPQELE